VLEGWRGVKPVFFCHERLMVTGVARGKHGLFWYSDVILNISGIMGGIGVMVAGIAVCL